MRKKTAIDTKDLKILKVLDDLGGNASAAEIGEKLNIPARTVRHRISMMMERGILLPSFLQTRERKVGLGEKVVIVQENPEMGEALEKAIERLPIFYWYIPTYGRYNGYLIHAVYDMRAPKTIEKLTQRMKKLGLITGCETFDIVDYESKRVDFSKYRPNGTWRFDWNKWMENIAGNISNESEIPHHMDEDCDIIEYDAADLEILKILKGDPETPMLTLATLTNLPITQVRERVQHLRDTAVIRGVRRAYGFVGDLLWFSCFFEIEKATGGILKSLYELPFPGVVLMESMDRYCFRFGFTTSDLKRFLEGFRLFRPHLKSYFFQFHLPDRVDSEFQDIFGLFDAKNNRWDMPLDRFLEIVNQATKTS